MLSSFFGGDMFGGGEFTEMMSSVRTGSFEPGTSTSTRTTTFIENGKRITKTTTTRQHADGRVETHVRALLLLYPFKWFSSSCNRLLFETSAQSHEVYAESASNNMTSCYHASCDYCRVPKFSPNGPVCCACASRLGLPRTCHSG